MCKVLGSISGPIIWFLMLYFFSAVKLWICTLKLYTALPCPPEGACTVQSTLIPSCNISTPGNSHMPGTGLSASISCVSYCRDKVPEKTTEGRVYFGVPIWGCSPPWQESGGELKADDHTAFAVGKPGEMNAVGPCSLYLSHSIQDSYHGMVLTTFSLLP